MIHRSHQSKPKAIKKKKTHKKKKKSWLTKKNWQLEGQMNPANGASCDHFVRQHRQIIRPALIATGLNAYFNGE
jgi:hypothetical protein